MCIYCDSCACFTGRNYFNNCLTQLKKPEEVSSAVKLVRLRMSVYTRTFVLKPVSLNLGVTLNILSNLFYECNGKKTALYRYILTSGYKYPVYSEILTANNNYR
jgi:hypothetical protein